MSQHVIKGFVQPDQTITVPEYDDTDIIKRLTLLEGKVAALEAEATIPPTPPTGGLFLPTSFYNAKLPDGTLLHPNSAGLVLELTRQSKPQNTDTSKPLFNPATPVYNTATYDPELKYYPGLNTLQYSSACITVTDPAVPKVPVRIVKGGVEQTTLELNKRLKLGVRIPAGSVPAAGTDSHLSIYDKVGDVLVELWLAKQVNGQWEASWGGIIENVSASNGVFPIVNGEKWGATATSLSLRGGVITLEQLRSGVIGHCIGMAIPEGPNRWVSPALRTDTNVKFWEGPNAIPAGTRFRFPKDIFIDPNWVKIVQLMVAAVRDFGCVVQDRAGAVTFYGEDTSPYSGLTSTGKKRDLIAEEFYGGQLPHNFLKTFPFTKLQALPPV